MFNKPHRVIQIFDIILFKASSSLGSSLSRVSSSPSSTPTDSEVQSQIVTHVLLQTTNKITNHIISNSQQEGNIEAPPIVKRPERTKSIVSYESNYCDYKINDFIFSIFSIRVQ